MTSAELRDILVSPDFKRELRKLSSYLASIMQERPIVYLLAKCLWKRGRKFELEHKHCDLCLEEKRVEFKFNYDKMAELLRKELARCPDLSKTLDAVRAGWIGESRGVMARIYKDVVDKQPHIFVWIICSRDLRKLPEDDLKRVAAWREQRRYSDEHPWGSNDEFLTVAESFLDKLQAVRPFSVLKEKIETRGDFPSSYHFMICEFSQTA